MNAETQEVVFSSGTDNWQTPDELFATLDCEFDFTLDVAADATNFKCANWYGPGSVFYQNALGPNPWRGRVWCNPPYSRCADFVRKAADSAKLGALVVMLIPSRTDTKYWHEHIWDLAANDWRPGVRARFVKGRVKFIPATGEVSNSAPFPSVVVVFRAR